MIVCMLRFFYFVQVNKLVELYKECSEEWSRKAGELEGVIKALEVRILAHSFLDSKYVKKIFIYFINSFNNYLIHFYMHVLAIYICFLLYLIILTY